MSFQWLEMRISEETDRRKRETDILERLPGALKELHEALGLCVRSYRAAFGDGAAEIQLLPAKIRVTIRDLRDGDWKQTSRVEVVTDVAIPGFRIDQGTGKDPVIVEVGVLPGDKLFYRDREHDQYITMDELTKRTLDRSFFPQLKD